MSEPTGSFEQAQCRINKIQKHIDCHTRSRRKSNGRISTLMRSNFYAYGGEFSKPNNRKKDFVMRRKHNYNRKWKSCYQ